MASAIECGMANDIPAKLASLVVTDLPKRLPFPATPSPHHFGSRPGCSPALISVSLVWMLAKVSGVRTPSRTCTIAPRFI